MTFRQYLMIMTIGTILAASAFLFVLFRVDPVTAGAVGRLLFFITLSLTLVGFFSTVGVTVRLLLYRNKLVVHREVVRAFRQGLFFTTLIVAHLLLAAFGFLRWWTTLLLILLFGLFELFFWTTRQTPVVQSPSE